MSASFIKAMEWLPISLRFSLPRCLGSLPEREKPVLYQETTGERKKNNI
jgi:hypothetical protein